MATTLETGSEQATKSLVNYRLDGGAEQLSRDMGNIFFRGISSGRTKGVSN